jgi:integrase
VQVRARIVQGPPHGISGKTAMYAWSVLRTTFKEAVSSRDRTMRVRKDDPTSGIKPPLWTKPRKKTFIYPSEFAKLVACTQVPRAWRELYAIAFYLYLRPGELRALTWADVDLDALVVHVTKAYNEVLREVTEPKTANGVRDIPIEPTLEPLLTVLRARASQTDAVAPLLTEYGEKFRAKMLREHLRVAGVTRPRLFESTATTVDINFRSCRDSGITWLALASVDLVRMQRRAGHDDIHTTLGYVKQAEDLTGRIGAPFAPLPPELLGEPLSSPKCQPTCQVTRLPPKTPRKWVPEEGIEGAQSDSISGFLGESNGSVGVGNEKFGDDPRHMDQLVQSVDVVETALATALGQASAAGQWGVVETLARELEARRVVRAKVGVGEVIDLGERRRGR